MCSVAKTLRWIPPSSASILNRLLPLDWHYQHENIALALQRLADSSSVDSLYLAAQSRHAYLDYDQAYALAVKCIWALGAIGTDEAREKLQRLAASEKTVISLAAQHQLARLSSSLAFELWHATPQRSLGLSESLRESRVSGTREIQATLVKSWFAYIKPTQMPLPTVPFCTVDLSRPPSKNDRMTWIKPSFLLDDVPGRLGTER